MPNWMTAVVVPVAIVLLNLAAQFYFKWVPDVEDQKRHLTRAFWWAADILSFVWMGYWLYAYAHSKQAVTPVFVVVVSFTTASLAFCAIMIFFRRSILNGLLRQHFDHFGRLLDHEDKNMEIRDLHLKATKQHRDALCTLSNDPNLSPETAQALRAILDTAQKAIGQ